MTEKHFLKASHTLGIVAGVVLCTTAAWAQTKPWQETNGTIAGNVDGHTFDLPVLCQKWFGPFGASSHDQPFSNSKSIGGVEPAVSVDGHKKGFTFVAFIGGSRYHVINIHDTIETLPFTVTREIRARDHGKIELSFTLDCQIS